MRYIIGLATFLFSCGHCMQTRPTCVLEQYGFIHFYNFTETAKTAFVRHEYDGHEHELFANVVEPHTMHVYRVYPGRYIIGLQYPNGTQVSLKNPKGGKNYYVPLCDTLPIVMKYPVEKDPNEGKIRPRRIG